MADVVNNGAVNKTKWGVEADKLNAKFNSIDADLTTINGSLTNINGRLDGVDFDLTTVNGRLDGIDSDLTNVNGRLDGVDSDLTTINGRLDGIDSDLTTINTTVGNIDGRVNSLETLLQQIDIRLQQLEGEEPDENLPPTDITLSSTSINENNSINDVIGIFNTVDANAGDTFTYSLVDGTGDTDNASFTIVGNELQALEVFDYEIKSSYSIRVRSTDQEGLFIEKTFIINVTMMQDSWLLSSGIWNDGGVWVDTEVWVD